MKTQAVIQAAQKRAAIVKDFKWVSDLFRDMEEFFHDDPQVLEAIKASGRFERECTLFAQDILEFELQECADLTAEELLTVGVLSQNAVSKKIDLAVLADEVSRTVKADAPAPSNTFQEKVLIQKKIPVEIKLPRADNTRAPQETHRVVTGGPEDFDAAIAGCGINAISRNLPSSYVSIVRPLSTITRRAS